MSHDVKHSVVVGCKYCELVSTHSSTTNALYLSLCFLMQALQETSVSWTTPLAGREEPSITGTYVAFITGVGNGTSKGEAT